jgi:hypothetical protein
MALAWVWDPKREGGGSLGREWLEMGGKMKGVGDMEKNKNVCGGMVDRLSGIVCI